MKTCQSRCDILLFLLDAIMRPTGRVLQSMERYLELRRNTVGFIGLGRMGSAMARNLFRKRYEQSQDTVFVVCDAIPEAAESFSARFLADFPGAKLGVALNPEEVVLASTSVVTMLPSSPEVRAVYQAEHGLIPTLIDLPAEAAMQTLLIDSTTLDIEAAKQVSEKATEAGAQMVDAPVSGGVSGAKAATLSFLVGGTEETFHQAKPTLELMGKRIVHCGSSTSGLAAKICNNMILGVQQVAVAEAMLLGQKMGLESSILAEVINSSTGACWASSVNNPAPGALPGKEPPCEREYAGGFASALMLKDMGLATNAAAASRSATPLSAAAESLYKQMISDKNLDLSRKDFSSVYLYLKQLSDTSLESRK